MTRQYLLRAFFLIALFASSPAFAQSTYWQPVATFDMGHAVGFTSHSTLGIVAVSDAGEVMHSNDGGITWTELTSDLLSANAITTDAYVSSIIYAATSNGLWRSSNGKEWIDAGLEGRNVRAIDIVGIANAIVAGTSSGIAVSTNRGDTWEFFNDGLPTTNIQAVGAAQSTYMYAGTPSGLYSYTNGEEAWEGSAIGNQDVRVIFVASGVILSGTRNALFVNTNKVSGLTLTSPVTALSYASPNIFVGTGTGLHYRDKDGKWQMVNDGLASASVTALQNTAAQHMLVATNDGAIYRSINPITTLLRVDGEALEVRSAYPNPANDFITFNTGSDQILEIQIVDVTGRTLSTSKVEGSSITLPTSQLPQGSYSAVIRTTEGLSLDRFVVQH